MSHSKLSSPQKTFIQLELDFTQAMALALAEPEQANVLHLCQSVELVLTELDQQQRLKFAGEALCEIAEVCQRRAQIYWQEWQEQQNDEGPILESNYLEGLTRDSMYLDLSAVLKPLKGRDTVPSNEFEDRGESEVTEIPKEVALLMTTEAEKFDVQRLEYDENVSAWAKILKEWMLDKNVKSIAISEIADTTNLSVVKTWLAGLLSDFNLQQTSHFYSSDGLRLTLE